MKKLWKYLVLAGILCQAQTVFAAGFLIGEQSVSAMGTAFASRTTAIDDAGTVYANPAGMTSLCSCTDIVSGIFLINPDSHFKNHGSEGIIAPVWQQGLGSLAQSYPAPTNGGQIGETKYVPNLAFVRKCGSRFAVGLSVNAPFGLATDYNDRWWGRYYATNSEIITININPAAAWTFYNCPNFSATIGAGFNAMYFHAMLKNMINTTGIFQSEFPGVPLLIPDAEVKIKGNCWGYGGNVGLLFKFNCDRTRFGVQYRSQVRQHIKNGRITFKDLPDGFEQSLANGNAETVVILPDIISFGLMHRVTDCFTVYADFLWTHWSTIPNLTINFSNSPFQQKVILKWKDVWEFCVGCKYQVNNKLALKAGYLYDQNPTPNEVDITPRLPDQDRQAPCVGIQYRLTKCLSVDLSYGYVFFKRASVNKIKSPDEAGAPSFAGGLKGKYKTNAQLFGAQLHYQY